MTFVDHPLETIWRAMELYCSDRLSFTRIAEITGVADSTLRRWADYYEWREKREQIAKAEADIRADKVLARAKTIKALLDKPRADLAFAVSALEGQALKEAEAARQAEIRAAVTQAPAISIKTPEEAVAALREAVERRLSLLLTRPEAVDLKAIQEVQKCLSLISDMEKASPGPTENKANKGLSGDLHARLLAVLSGKEGV